MRYASRVDKLTWDMINELKAISIISPVYCFGGAALWAKALPTFGVPNEDSLFLSEVSLVAGMAFFLSLLMQVFLRPKQESGRGTESVKIYDALGNKAASGRGKITPALYATFFLICLGISLFMCIILDAGYLLLKK